MIRRIHQKVRTGCSECKRRRIKCDERRPICVSCQRNRLHCSLAFLTSVFRPDRRGVISSPPRSSLRIASFSSPSLGLNPSPLDSLSLELLHHYETTVCYTIGSSKSWEIWRSEITRLAFSHEFLLRGTLALSALHLSRLVPARSEQLLTRAIQEEASSLPSFRSLVANPDVSNMAAIFAFSGTVVPYMIATHFSNRSSAGKLPSRNDEEPHWFLGIRGLVKLTVNNLELLEQGMFAPLIVKRVVIRNCTDNPNDHHIAKLQALFTPCEVPYAPVPQTTTFSNDLRICEHAMEGLRRMFTIPYSKCRSWLDIKSAVSIWPGCVLPRFIELLYDRVPEALVVLAYFCVLLKDANSCWYFEGLGVALLDTIQTELGEEWQPWLQWAIEQPVSQISPLETCRNVDWKIHAETADGTCYCIESESEELPSHLYLNHKERRHSTN